MAVLYWCFFTGPEAIQKLWGMMADKLLEAVGIEPDTEIVGIMMDSLCKVRVMIITSVCVCVCNGNGYKRAVCN